MKKTFAILLVTILALLAAGALAAGDDGVRADLSAFPDAGSVARYARDAMAWAVGRGIVNGVGSGSVSTLSPRAGASRAQVAAMLMRCLTQDRPTEVIR